MAEKIRVILIDDDPIERMAVRHLLAKYDSIAIVDEAENITAGMEKILLRKPDAIFLDVYMPGGQGFEMLHGLDVLPHVIFVTSSPDHTLEAFEVEAVDYLLKPVSSERFKSTVRRLERLCHRENVPPVRHESTDRLCLRANKETHVVSLNQVLFLQAEGNFTHVHCANDLSVLVGRAIGEFEDILPSPPFTRISRSLIVNHKRISRAIRESRDLCRLWFHGHDTPLELGRSATEQLQNVFKDFS